MTTARQTNDHEVPQPEELRAAMVKRLREMGAVRSNRVAEAIGTVPRHLFAPGESLADAYTATSTLLTKRDEHGVAVSTVSAAYIQAMMLEQAQVEPGMRVLEIGSGGYNAALIAELVGPSGEVTTVDIDPDVVDRARDCLRTAGYGRVNAVLADAEGGVPEHAPYDRVIVTVGAWDIPPAWWDQLTGDGLIVVPLRMRGLTRSIVFAREGDRLVSRGYELCAFVAMRGDGAPDERLIQLDGDDITLRLDSNHPVDAEKLRAALALPRVEAWSGVTAAGDGRFDGLNLWWALHLPEFCVIHAQKTAVERGVVAHAWPLGVPAVVGADSIAYLGLRGVTPDRSTCEFGVYGHGPNADALIDRAIQLIRSWDGTSLDAQFTTYPAGTPDDQLPAGLVLDKRHTRVVLSWPDPEGRAEPAAE